MDTFKGSKRQFYGSNHERHRAAGGKGVNEGDTFGRKGKNNYSKRIDGLCVSLLPPIDGKWGKSKEKGDSKQAFVLRAVKKIKLQLDEEEGAGRGKAQPLGEGEEERERNQGRGAGPAGEG